MIPYYLLIFLPIVIYLIGLSKGKKYNKTCIIMFFTILILLLAFRSIETGTDSKAYYITFNNISNLQFGNLLHYSDKEEFLFYVLNKIVVLIGGDFQCFLLVCSLISILPLLFLYKKEVNNSILMISLFLIVAPFSIFFSGIRQSLALGIVAIAYKFIKDKKIIPFLLLIVIASYFHKSAIFCLILYPLYHVKITNKWLIFIIPIMAFLFLFREQIFSIILQFISTSFYEAYNYIKPTGAFSILILLSLFAIYTYLLPDKTKLDKNYIGLRNFLLMAICIQFFASINSQIMRINYYLLLFIPLLIPKVKEKCKDGNIKLVNLIEFVMIVFFISSFFYKGFTDNDVLNIFPYIPFWG